MKNLWKQLKLFNWRLFFALCALSLVPAIYQTVKTGIISAVTQPSAFDVIGQMEWFDLIDETLRAFLIVPLYSILNKALSKTPTAFSRGVFKTGVAVFVLYALFSVGVLFYGEALVDMMNPGEVDLPAASRYLQLETVAFMLGIVLSFVNVVFVVVGKVKNVYIFLAVRTGLSVASDLLFIPRFGVYGVAASNILANGLLAAVSLWLLFRQKHIRPARFQKSDLPLLQEWCRVGVFSGAQQFVDNFIYAIMVCKMVNLVAEQGNYWVANNFIWGWLLIPISALSEIIKRDCAEGYRALRRSNYYCIAGATALLWLVTVPLWLVFYRELEGLANAEAVFRITVKLVPFYVAYAGSIIFDSIFIGLGKTAYTAINSLIVNLGYYGLFYGLYRTGALVFSMDVIIWMFGLGMVVHFLISLLQERLFLRKRAL